MEFTGAYQPIFLSLSAIHRAWIVAGKKKRNTKIIFSINAPLSPRMIKTPTGGRKIHRRMSMSLFI
jgi:hypothetical protein|tara:strand:+ start:33222 stop:33419 length:198 start_codon:yes stop_codon:yes gene_type:complete